MIDTRLTMMVAIGLLAAAGSSRAEVSANLGLVSDYIFRGIPQTDTSASAGVDFEHRGFYAGTWGADVGQGAEVDVYMGYGWQRGELSYGIGATGYFYTDDFDDTYREINLNLSYRNVSLEAAFGKYDQPLGNKTRQDYTFVALTGELKGFYAKMGVFGRDFGGDYFEAGYGTELSGFDLSLSVVHSSSELLGGDSENSVVFGVAKGFMFSE